MIVTDLLLPIVSLAYHDWDEDLIFNAHT